MKYSDKSSQWAFYVDRKPSRITIRNAMLLIAEKFTLNDFHRLQSTTSRNVCPYTHLGYLSCKSAWGAASP